MRFMKNEYKLKHIFGSHIFKYNLYEINLKVIHPKTLENKIRLLVLDIN